MGGRGNRIFGLFVVVVAIGFGLPEAASASGELIVRYAPGADRQAVREAAGVEHSESMLVPRTEVVTPADEVFRATAIRRLRALEGVRYVEPDLEMKLDVDGPTDTYFSYQWALENSGQPVAGLSYGVPGASIAALTGWNVARTSPDVVTAVIDTGIQLGHPDLSGQIWTNPGEVPGDGIDNDANGKVDDVNGWDFIGDQPLGVPDSHGTHVAGIIGATANNGIGISGVSQDANLMTLAACEETCAISRVVNAAEYARREGAKVVNLSLGNTLRSPTLRAVMEASPDVLFVASAGNDGNLAPAYGDLEVEPHYPCMEDTPALPAQEPLENVICVASSDLDDGKYASSNYGASGVDLAAPGVSILSTVQSGNYAFKTGTSMAAPHVSGAASLLRQLQPELSPAEVKQRILASVEPAPEFASTYPTVSGGRLDLARLFAAQLQPPELIGPADGATLTRVPVLRWTTPEERLVYTIEVDGEVADSLPRLRSLVPYWLGPGTHTWRVRATEIGNEGVATSEERSFTIVEPVTLKVLKLRPAGDRRGGVRVQLKVSAAGGIRVLARPGAGSSRKVLAKGSAAPAKAGKVTIVARPTKAGRRALGKKKRLGVRIQVVFRPRSGPVRELSRRAKMTAPRKPRR